jgi:hypothetical protein
MTPTHGVHPPDSIPRQAGERSPVGGSGLATLLALVLLVEAAVGAAACGGSSLTPAVSRSPTPAPGTKPLTGCLRDAATAYWRLVDSDDYAAIAGAGVPGAPPSARPGNDDILHARLVAVDRVDADKNDPSSRLLQVRVFIEPLKRDQLPTPWGRPARHTLFMYMAKAPHGGWLVRSWGTGP